MSPGPLQMSPALLGSPIYLPVFLKAVRAGFPSPADDYLDAPIDLSRTLIQNAPATFIVTVAGNSAVDVGIFDGSGRGSCGMNAFVHQVEIKLPEAEAPERLRRIESWCGDWEIGYRVLHRQPHSESIRLAFEERRLARAFIGHFGGVLVDEREIEDAMDASAASEDVYERLAREFNA